MLYQLQAQLKNQILESLSSILYHFTNIGALSSMLRDNKIFLTMSAGSRADAMLNQGKFYFLSMQTSRNGGYGKRLNMKVKLVLDGDKLNQKFKGGPKNYWDFTTGMSQEMAKTYKFDDKHRVEADEFEERMFSDKDSIKATDYILEIHILTFDKWNPGEKGKGDGIYSYILKRAKALNIPAFIYDDESAYWNEAKRKAIEIDAEPSAPAVDRFLYVDSGADILAFITPVQDYSKVAEEVEKNGFLKPTQEKDPTGTYDKNWFLKKMNTFASNYSLKERNPDGTLRYYSNFRDMEAAIDAGIHNHRSSTDPFYRWVFQKFVAAFRKEKVSTIKEYINKKFGAYK